MTWLFRTCSLFIINIIVSTFSFHDFEGRKDKLLWHVQWASLNNSPSTTYGGSGPVFSKLMTTPLWTFWTKDSRHWFSILCVRTQYDRPDRKKNRMQIDHVHYYYTSYKWILRLCGNTSKENSQPPVTSHIWVMADSSVGTLPSCSLSGVAAPGSLSTSANSLWSQRNGSLVSSLPAKGELRGRCS